MPVSKAPRFSTARASRSDVLARELIEGGLLELVQFTVEPLRVLARPIPSWVFSASPASGCE